MDVDVTEETFKPLRYEIIKHISDFQQSMPQTTTIREWIEIRTHLTLAASADIFDLAITSQIRNPKGDPALAAYFVRNKRNYKTRLPDVLAENRYENVMDVTTQQAHRWSSSGLCLSWTTTKQIIETVSEDPTSVTIATMDRKDTRWHCVVRSCQSVDARMMMN